jgi:rhomboid domain-containing protein 1
MHIGMNMMSTAAISSMLEKRMGTLQHAMTILWAMLLTSCVYTIASIFMHVVLGMDGLMYQHSVGFSGVIFHLSVLECNITPHRSRSVFGFLTVPAYLYPWALLVVLQLFMPNLSLMGHLAGILTGTLQFFGVLDAILVSDAYLQEMEKWIGLRFLTGQPNFVATPVSLDAAPRDPAAFRRALGSGIQTAVTFVKNILETILVCIFGRSRDANDNIQLRWPLAGRTGDAVAEFEEEDDWVGLPSLSVPVDRDAVSRIV